MAIPILNCTKLFKFRCPKKWSTVEGKPGELIRFCKSCKKNVYLCKTPEEVLEQAEIGGCIAIVAKDKSYEFTVGQVSRQMSREDAADEYDCITLYTRQEGFTIDDAHLLDPVDEKQQQKED